MGDHETSNAGDRQFDAVPGEHHNELTNAGVFDDNLLPLNNSKASADLIEKIQLEEAIVELERTLMGQGWERLSLTAPLEFSRWGLTRIVRFARLSYLKNPLIHHAVDLQADYVFAMGLNVHHDDDDINRVIQAWWDDPKNKEEFTDPEALWQLEVDFRISGNMFFGFFTKETTGRVVIRAFPFDEMMEIITNPEDVRETWYYKRVWHYDEFDYATGEISGREKTAYYPDWRYHPDPKDMVKQIGNWPVMWDVPIMHIRGGGLRTMKFGVPEIYSSLDWAKAVKDDLEDYATIKHALAKFAWNLTTKGGQPAIDAIKKRFQTGISNMEGESNPPPTKGSVFITGEGNKLDPIRTSGAAPNPEEGRRMWLMAGAGAGLPETILAGDANVGNLATATSLDRPTELRMTARRNLWTKIIQNIVGYVISRAAEIGNIPGVKVTTDETTGEVYATKRNPDTGYDERVVAEIDWPPILERDPQGKVNSIISALTFDGKTDAGIVSLADKRRMILTAVGEDDIDRIIKDAEGEEAKKKKDEEAAAEKGANAIVPPALVANQARPAGEQPPGSAEGKAIQAAGKAALAANNPPQLAMAASDADVIRALGRVNQLLEDMMLDPIGMDEIIEDDDGDES